MGLTQEPKPQRGGITKRGPSSFSRITRVIRFKPRKKKNYHIKKNLKSFAKYAYENV